MSRHAIIFGAGSGISASFARLCAREGYALTLVSRNSDKLGPLAHELKARAVSCDATNADDVARVFADLDDVQGGVDLLLYNASSRQRGSVLDVAPEDVAAAVGVTALGGYNVAQQAAKRMVAQGAGTILFTGASASIKGYPKSAPFAMGKFALRGLAQSMARELAPLGVHVAHFVIDGGVRSEERGRVEGPGDPDGKWLDPDAIAQTYMHIAKQPKSAWSWEVELRPWVETF